MHLNIILSRMILVAGVSYLRFNVYSSTSPNLLRPQISGNAGVFFWTFGQGEINQIQLDLTERAIKHARIALVTHHDPTVFAWETTSLAARSHTCMSSNSVSTPGGTKHVSSIAATLDKQAKRKCPVHRVECQMRLACLAFVQRSSLAMTPNILVQYMGHQQLHHQPQQQNNLYLTASSYSS